MHNVKCFISAGCSFSQVPNADVTWPVHIRDCLQPECTYYLGQGAAGNGIISRKVIHTVQKVLEIYNTDELMVGIMWSGHDRMDAFYPEKPSLSYEPVGAGADNYTNPVRVAKENNYYIMNHHWNDELTKTYYKYFYSKIGACIQTIEHILRTQWFLQNLGIRYFMTEYNNDCLPRDPEIINHSDVKYLYDMIDKSYWVPIDNMYKFAVSTGKPFARPPDVHPSTEHHQLFVKDVCMPWLFRKYFFSKDNQ